MAFKAIRRAARGLFVLSHRVVKLARQLKARTEQVSRLYARINKLDGPPQPLNGFRIFATREVKATEFKPRVEEVASKFDRTLQPRFRFVQSPKLRKRVPHQICRLCAHARLVELLK